MVWQFVEVVLLLLLFFLCISSLFFGSVFLCITVKNNQSRQFSPPYVTHYRIELLLNLFNEHTFWSIVWTRFLSTFLGFSISVFCSYMERLQDPSIEDFDGRKIEQKWMSFETILLFLILWLVLFDNNDILNSDILVLVKLLFSFYNLCFKLYGWNEGTYFGLFFFL